MPLVKIPPVLRASVSGMSEVDIEGATVGEVLKGLADQFPDTGEQLLSGEGELNRYVNVYVNDEDVRVQNGLETEVGQSDTVVILPAMAGGSLNASLLPNKSLASLAHLKHHVSTTHILRARLTAVSSCP